MSDSVQRSRGLWGFFRRNGREAVLSRLDSAARLPQPAAFQALFGNTGLADMLSPEAVPPARVPEARLPPPPAPAQEVAPEALPGRARISASAYTAPDDLTRTPLKPLRVLAIGSCFLNDLLWSLPASIQRDFVLAGEIARFPAEPPGDMAGYDCQIIQMPLRVIIRDMMFNNLAYDDKQGFAKAFETARKAVRQHLECRLKWNASHGTLTFVLNFMEPQFNVMGRFHSRFDLRNIGYFVSRLNEEIEAVCQERSNVHVLDVDKLAASFGRRYVQDDSITTFNHNTGLSPNMRSDGRMQDPGPLSDTYELTPGADFRTAVLDEISAMYRTARQIDSVKLVVVDLDDTLWKGVAGDASDVGPHMVEGWPLGFMEALHTVRKRGVLLAIISKNDEARIRSIWKSILGAYIKLDDFAAIRINWESKVENMRAILKGVNLLPRNVVFIDDNPKERAQMEGAFPDMRVIGSNPFVLRRILLLAPEMQVTHITEESANRTAMIQSQAVRETEKAALTPEEFAQQQNVCIEMFAIRDTTHAKFPRALELINKTNQFNTTGRRWTAAEIQAFLSEGGSLAAWQVEDRYTPYGLVGVVILKGGHIAQWVMSCRVIGMGVEQAVMHALVTNLRAHGAQAIRADLIATNVNQPCQSLYSSSGFEADGDAWLLDPARMPAEPQFVTVRADLA